MTVKFLPITDRECLNYHYTIWSRHSQNNSKNNVLETLGKLSKNESKGIELKYVDTNLHSNPTEIAKKLSNKSFTNNDIEDAFIIKSRLKYENIIEHELEKILGEPLENYKISYYKTRSMAWLNKDITESTITSETNIPEEYSKVSSYGLFLLVEEENLKHIVIDYITGTYPKICVACNNMIDIFELCYERLECVWSI